MSVRVDPHTGEIVEYSRGVHFEPSDPDSAPLEPADLAADDDGGWDRATILVVRGLGLVTLAVSVWVVVTTPIAILAVVAVVIAQAFVVRHMRRG